MPRSSPSDLRGPQRHAERLFDRAVTDHSLRGGWKFSVAFVTVTNIPRTQPANSQDRSRDLSRFATRHIWLQLGSSMQVFLVVFTEDTAHVDSTAILCDMYTRLKSPSHLASGPNMCQAHYRGSFKDRLRRASQHVSLFRKPRIINHDFSLGYVHIGGIWSSLLVQWMVECILGPSLAEDVAPRPISWKVTYDLTDWSWNSNSDDTGDQ
ncbi:hypothetical protein BR93DRAFT_462287 [Coniochaeta sp. PMI_546]|nr:hypothetical protein BR93DRAFT_462287 [Coniochaeta sp. PMI_546]